MLPFVRHFCEYESIFLNCKNLKILSYKKINKQRFDSRDRTCEYNYEISVAVKIIEVSPRCYVGTMLESFPLMMCLLINRAENTKRDQTLGKAFCQDVNAKGAN